MNKKVKKNKEDDFELNFCMGVIEKAPRFCEALSLLGDILTKRGCYKEGLDVDQRLASLRPDDPVVLYNLACSYSLLDDIDMAFETLKKAVEIGYDDFEYLKSDSDLHNLRKDLRFGQYFSQISRKNKIK